MKRITIRVAVALSTFIIGIIVVANWLVIPAPNVSDIPLVENKVEISAPDEIPAPTVYKATPDSTVYSVKFCELIRNSDKYDGKIVRIQAFYKQDIDTSVLTDSKCNEWLRPHCNREVAPCEKIWSRIGFNDTRVDIVGRYTADIVDPNPLQNGYHIRLFDILELKDAKPTKIRR
jgi:hypothetical protein